MNDKYLTVKDVAEMLQISYENALHYIKHNVEYVTIGKQYRVSEKKLNAALYPPKAVKTRLNSRPVYQIVERVKS